MDLVLKVHLNSGKAHVISAFLGFLVKEQCKIHNKS